MKKLLDELGACSSAKIWAKGKDLATIWTTCDRADWLFWLAGRMEGKRGWPTRQEIVLAACECAELALPYVTQGEDRPRIAIETARKWAHGEATLDEVQSAAYAAYAAARGSASCAAREAAIHVAYAAAHAAYAAASAANAGAHAAYAAADANAAAETAADADAHLGPRCLAIARERLAPAALDLEAK